jgi:hypothetical protein
VLRSRAYEKKTIKAELEIKAKNVMKVSRKKLNLLRLNVLLGHAFLCKCSFNNPISHGRRMEEWGGRGHI